MTIFVKNFRKKIEGKFRLRGLQDRKHLGVFIAALIRVKQIQV